MSSQNIYFVCFDKKSTMFIYFVQIKHYLEFLQIHLNVIIEHKHSRKDYHKEMYNCISFI